jgi:DNA-binding beta-propeller fold protein YncE
VAFDGTSIWVANFSSNNVTKLRASDGTTLTFPVGTNPFGVAFDGANIWVTNNGSDTVTKLSSSGAKLGTFAVGTNPFGVAFDGANIWVANQGSATVSKLSEGVVSGKYFNPLQVGLLAWHRGASPIPSAWEPSLLA